MVRWSDGVGPAWPRQIKAGTQDEWVLILVRDKLPPISEFVNVTHILRIPFGLTGWAGFYPAISTRRKNGAVCPSASPGLATEMALLPGVAFVATFTLSSRSCCGPGSELPGTA